MLADAQGVCLFACFLLIALAYLAWYRVYNAWPTALAYSDLDAGANQLLIEQMTLAHEGFDFDLASNLGQDAATPPVETFPSGY